MTKSKRIADLYLANVPYQATKVEIFNFLRDGGAEVVNQENGVRKVIDRATGRSRGIAYASVYVADDDDLDRLVRGFRGREIAAAADPDNRRTVTVQVAHEQRQLADRPPSDRPGPPTGRRPAEAGR